MSKKLVVSPDQMPDWLEKRRSIMSEIDGQLIRGFREPGKGLTLEQLQSVVEHRNPFEVPLVGDGVELHKNKSADEKLGDFLSSVDTDKFEILWDGQDYAGIVPRCP